MASFDNIEYERLGQEIYRLAREYHRTHDRAIVDPLAAVTEKRAAMLRSRLFAESHVDKNSRSSFLLSILRRDSGGHGRA
jgi:hypothetical protein